MRSKYTHQEMIKLIEKTATLSGRDAAREIGISVASLYNWRQKLKLIPVTKKKVTPKLSKAGKGTNIKPELKAKAAGIVKVTVKKTKPLNFKKLIKAIDTIKAAVEQCAMMG